ncbi:unnamed protein product, partial [Ascophyllum nodosum]
VTQLHTNDVHCRESAGTGSAVLKVHPLEVAHHAAGGDGRDWHQAHDVLRQHEGPRCESEQAIPQTASHCCWHRRSSGRDGRCGGLPQVRETSKVSPPLRISRTLMKNGFINAETGRGFYLFRDESLPTCKVSLYSRELWLDRDPV